MFVNRLHRRTVDRIISIGNSQTRWKNTTRKQRISSISISPDEQWLAPSDVRNRYRLIREWKRVAHAKKEQQRFATEMREDTKQHQKKKPKEKNEATAIPATMAERKRTKKQQNEKQGKKCHRIASSSSRNGAYSKTRRHGINK